MNQNSNDDILARAAFGSAEERTAAELLKALETRRLLGDPRVRVAVPTDGTPADQQSSSMSRRYMIG